MNLQLLKAALSPEIRKATACFPSAPEGGKGALFCYEVNINRDVHSVNLLQEKHDHLNVAIIIIRTRLNMIMEQVSEISG